MANDDRNNFVPEDLLINIAQRSSCPEDYYRLSAVCKSWNLAASEAAASLEEFVIDQKPWWLLLRGFPTTTPMLLLAEEVAPEDAEDFNLASYDYSKNSVGSSRGLYSLSLNKTYNIELPEAAGKLILSTSKGWLLTLGRDLQIHLLHPLFRYQVSLPPMLTFPRQYEYNKSITPEDDSAYFISKVAMSSRLLKEKADVTQPPIVMTVYGSLDSLGFARLGDKVWTDVNVNSNSFHDIVYYRENFYAVNSAGDVYVCCIDGDDEIYNNEKCGFRGEKIASIKINNVCNRKFYLVEPLSGSGLLLIVRYFRFRHLQKRHRVVTKYRTTEFAVWRLDLDFYDSACIRLCTLIKENNLGAEAIFVGRASSLSVPSSDTIKPNSIYFTDDNWKYFTCLGGGHDMGIFNMERRTIEPHYQGKSIHCISPPLWYI
ncbi:putative F-box protein At5g55150 [Apium graveolens]|uniref:putative F-box protein At5g55150 n=1 Tax=Apium graveolens TaxID=4045 RepID=UPI003D7BF328